METAIVHGGLYRDNGKPQEKRGRGLRSNLAVQGVG